MTAFHPTQTLLQTPAVPDRMAGAVLQSLSRAAKPGPSPGLFRVIFSGVLTLGLWPMLMWPRRNIRLIRYDKDQLWHLTEWLRQRLGAEKVYELDGAMKQVRLPLLLWGLGWTWAGVCLLITVGWFLQMPLFPVGRWVELWQTAGFSAEPYTVTYFMEGTWRLSVRLATMWFWTVTPFFSMHWLAMQFHAAAVRRYVAAFNQVSLRHGIMGVDVPGVGLGLRPLWMLSGLILAMMGALWAIPMMLAGAIQRTYSVNVARATRTQLAEKVRLVMGMLHPEMASSKPVWIGELCQNTLCRARLSAGAQYCPRCGQRVNNSAGSKA